ncbi:MAG: cell division protein FtsZ [Alphaproteobacteria bacterium]|nr:cell division protein FtsZ [Alphaproteobacteria bacterium]
MSINLGVADTAVSYLKPRIAVVGVGGGGGNAVNNMISQNLEGVDFIVANTDAQALAHSSASKKIQLGLEITQGLGAGARPEIGQMAAEEAKEKIAEALEGVNMVFITAGMGGGTGSGAAPVVAHIAKEKGILTVGVVTKPFSFEGKKRMEIAEKSLGNFIKEVDSIIVIPNQNLFNIANENTTLSEAFKMADNVLYSGVRSITDLMMMPGLINLDFADVKNIMEDKGKAIMGTGEAEGKGRAREAANQALSNPLLDDCSLQGAKGVLINITGSQDITLPELDEAANIIKEEVGDDANIIFGSSYDDALSGKIRVSIVVTGINDGVQRAPEPVQEKKPEPSLLEQSYSTDTFVPTVEAPVNDFTATDDLLAASNENDDDVFELSNDSMFNAPEEIEDLPLPESSEEDAALDNDFASLGASHEIPEMPPATALFNAIMNNDNKAEENEKADMEFSSAAPSDDFFASTRPLENPDANVEEPILFNNTDTSVFKGLDEPKPEQEEQPALEPEEESRLSFMDKVLGFRRRNHEEQEKRERAFSDEGNLAVEPELSSDDLDIPSFLRRK